jgi:hypothetical protein
MSPDFEPLARASFDASDQPSIVEQIFANPERISQGEYWTIYEFLLSPDIRDDVDAIAGVLREFAEWAQYMLEQMRKKGLIEND